MKRLILMGGRPWLGPDKGQAFAQALLDSKNQTVNIAYCIFAQPESDWAETERVNTDMLTEFADGKNLVFQTMTEDNFLDISEWADVVYMPGGDPAQLRQALDAHGEVATLWNGKTIAGSSAGADIMCEQFMYLQDKTIHEGYGWVRAVCIPHWLADFKGWKPDDWLRAEQVLQERFPELPILRIPESQFVQLTVA